MTQITQPLNAKTQGQSPFTRLLLAMLCSAHAYHWGVEARNLQYGFRHLQNIC